MDPSVQEPRTSEPREFSQTASSQYGAAETGQGQGDGSQAEWCADKDKCLAVMRYCGLLNVGVCVIVPPILILLTNSDWPLVLIYGFGVFNCLLGTVACAATIAWRKLCLSDFAKFPLSDRRNGSGELSELAAWFTMFSMYVCVFSMFIALDTRSAAARFITLVAATVLVFAVVAWAVVIWCCIAVHCYRHCAGQRVDREEGVPMLAV